MVCGNPGSPLLTQFSSPANSYGSLYLLKLKAYLLFRSTDTVVLAGNCIRVTDLTKIELIKFSLIKLSFLVWQPAAISWLEEYPYTA